jgi:Fur family peroxide stress response transcriptional regulator
MSAVLADERLSQQLAAKGLRLTVRRRLVYSLLLRGGAHPSAEEVFLRARKERPEISLATVYNCLETLVGCGLVRQVQADRGPSRYCSNLQQHVHSHCDRCGATFDVAWDEEAVRSSFRPPAGFTVNRCEVVLRGVCRDCMDKS